MNSVKIIIKDNRYIPFLNTVGPILTPVKVPREIYKRLLSGGLKVELFEGHISTVEKAKEVIVVKEAAKEEKVNFNDLKVEAIEETVEEPIVEEVIEEVVEEVEYEEVEVEEEVVEEEQPQPKNKKKKK